jgi:phospholipase A1
VHFFHSPHRVRHAALACGAGFWIGAVLAQDNPADCTRIDDDVARLTCYDRAHKREPIPAGVNQPSPAPAAAASAPLRDAEATMFEDRWDVDGRRKGELFYPRAYKPVYLLPLTWSDSMNRMPTSPAPDRSVTTPLDLDSVELKYQISFKSKLWDDILGSPLKLWGAYTQSSRWQVFNAAQSRPFRETDYEPEVILSWPLDHTALGWRLRQVSLALNHQSNGRSPPQSRSWNRVIGEAGFEVDDWTVQLRPWARLKEDPGNDDNPDIADYAGRGEMLITTRLGKHILALQLRHSLRGGERSRGSAQLDWSYPLGGALHLYTQWFSGYGESLIDYNHRQNKLGVGFSVVDWR